MSSVDVDDENIFGVQAKTFFQNLIQNIFFFLIFVSIAFDFNDRYVSW